MYLIAGLGNPTREYDKTRHNVGFSVIDVLADKYNIDVSDRKHKALCGKGVIEGNLFEHSFPFTCFKPFPFSGT